ncbi:hypothetical protein RM190_09790 [Paracoccus sp. CPCC 101403]|uniref:TonB-dependent receptor n=1 Tax=Paracoccus broussonetiae TaxID=3075834 RepID=A0ABU3ED34_9RHOB|nr:hypothetical protein [Paracoccus sp. CPCC 101403]MDT1062149.1 hypothetical protein [Paracoccus sp. CPCC 101403]
MKPFRLSWLTWTSLISLSLPVMAQGNGAAADATAAGATVVLDGVVLDATASTHGYVVPTAQIATKTEAKVFEAQQSVSVITNQQTRDQGA